MLKAKDSRVEPTEHDIYKFAPVFPKGISSGVYLRYYQHRERVLTGNSTATDIFTMYYTLEMGKNLNCLGSVRVLVKFVKRFGFGSGFFFQK